MLGGYLVDEGIQFVHYFANRVGSQFRLDQDILKISLPF